MIDKITIRERGVTPRKIKPAYDAASKVAWVDTAKLFHTTMRDDRFTVAHGRKVGYTPRKGEESGQTAKAFWSSYAGQKLKYKKHKRPLEWSGETRRLVRSATVSSTSKGGKASYPGASKLNFRNPHSEIRMADEFRKIIPDEIEKLASHYDCELDRGLNADQTETTKQV